ncbi:MAG: hypothetical protein L3J39_16420 [Verrucomicrobiales bacterium]|nr:hypothetical protein [Verrucomicrobiales bacterium]
MPGKTNKNLASSVELNESLLFSWERTRSVSFWLSAFLVFSLLLHATGFYLFQVVYPSSGRVEPFPSRVLILDEKNPANATLIQELNDRLVFLQPASNGSKSRINSDDFAVSFRPSFADRSPPFKMPAAKTKSTQSADHMELPASVSLFPPFDSQDKLKPELQKRIPTRPNPSPGTR